MRSAAPRWWGAAQAAAREKNRSKPAAGAKGVMVLPTVIPLYRSKNDAKTQRGTWLDFGKLCTQNRGRENQMLRASFGGSGPCSGRKGEKFALPNRFRKPLRCAALRLSSNGMDHKQERPGFASRHQHRQTKCRRFDACEPSDQRFTFV